MAPSTGSGRGLSPAFLDEVRARTTLSALIGRSVKLTRAGREFKACCPVHSEKSPSFTINDEKGFGHCFGCGYHVDAFKWVQDSAGLTFIEAVRELALGAGLTMPERSVEAEARAAETAKRVETVRAALEVAQGAFVAQLDQAGAVLEYLAGRGVGPDEIAAFGIGFARGGDGSLRHKGIGEDIGRAAGLLVERSDAGGLRELLWDRITIPIHDHRGAPIGFGARIWPGGRATSSTPKFVNSPDGPLFDKGGTLFNLHRAASAARPPNPSSPNAENRLVIVEGYFDVIALARAGICAAVAPMGTALTERQLTRAWRVHHRPIVLFDGDAAGRRAARRACETALAFAAPGHELAVALLPEGRDPDDLVQALGVEDAAREIGALLAEARPLHAFLFEVVRDEFGARESGDAAPEATAGVWAALAELAAGIVDDETRAQYLGLWRARFEREVSAQSACAPQLTDEVALHALDPADPDPATGEVPTLHGVAYRFPKSESDSAAKLIALVQVLLKKRAERRQIGEEIADVLKMAEAIGFVKTEITAALRDIESDLKHGSGVREEAEMVRVLYRRTLGLRGPMSEAMLPSVVDARARPASATIKRRATMHALIDAGALAV